MAEVRKKQLCGRAEAKGERRKAGEWRSEAPRSSSEVRGETGGKEEEERSDKELGKEGEESAGHGALCCSPHLSLPGGAGKSLGSKA